MSATRVCDLTGLQALAELMFEARMKKVKVVIINEPGVIRDQLIHFGIKNDHSSLEVDLDEYLAQSELPTIGGSVALYSPLTKEKDVEAQTSETIDASSIEMTPKNPSDE
jgi:hypothetical protein